MESDSIHSNLSPPAFDGKNYQLWSVRMMAYLEAMDLWEAVEEDYLIAALPDNPTMAQIKSHKERKNRKSKAKATLFAAVSETIFARIVSLKSAKEVWDYLKKEYEGDARGRGMQVLNFLREFELQKMKDSELIKEYSDKLLAIANNIRLLGTDFSDSRIVQKILVTVPERYESAITTLENLKELSNITLAELLNALQAQDQRRLIRQEGIVEGALLADSLIADKKKNSHSSGGNSKKSYPPCNHCNKTGHPPFRCWRRPDAKCSRCNQLGHEAVICYSDIKVEAAQVVEEEELF